MSFLGNCTGTALLAASAVFVLLGAILGFVLLRGPAPLLRQHPGWAAVAGAVVVGLTAGTASLTASSCQAVPAACLGVQFAGRTNLVANPGFAAAATGPAPSTWVLSGTLAGGAPAGTIAPQMGTDLTSARIRVRPAADYCYQVDLTGTGHGQVLLLWDDASLQQVGYSALAPQSTGEPLRGAFPAPAGATYLRVLLRAIDGGPQFHAPAVAEAGVRVESWPNGAAGALAFSFDWESAMGGLIHSKSGHDLTYAQNRGLNMRAGADTLLGFFQAAHVAGTFYATGYNLLDGNTEHRQFVGNPLYKIGPDDGWATTWWLTNTWYSDDPYGTVASQPAWYFGDQTDRLAAAGQEIGSHTFGHLPVRNVKPAQFGADLDAWIAAAAARKLPPLRSFAFPWQSSNSLTPDFYRVLADHGVAAVTRVYPPDLCRNPVVCDYFVVRASPVYSPMLILPDFQLGITGPDTGEGGYQVITDTRRAQAIVDETIARRGATSFWNHPEVLIVPATRDTWQAVVTAAAQARDRGDLWIAPVAPLAQYWRDTGQVRVTTTNSGDRTQIAVLNRAPDALDGLTLTLPQPAQSVQIDGAAAPQRRPEQVVIPHLAAGQTVQVDVVAATGTGGP